MAIALMLAATWLAIATTAAADVDLIAEEVTFQTTTSNELDVRLVHTARADGGTPAWGYTYKVTQYRGGQVVQSFSAERKFDRPIDVSTCTAPCHASSYGGSDRGSCSPGVTCGCDFGNGPIWRIGNFASGDIFVMELTTTDQIEYDYTNNTARATF